MQLPAEKVSTNEGCILSFMLLIYTREEDRLTPKNDRRLVGVFIFHPSKKNASIFFLFQFYMGKMLPRQLNYSPALITEKFCLDKNQTAVLE